VLQFAATIGAVEKALRARMITPLAKEETILFLFAFREHISRNTRSIFAIFWGLLPMTVAQFSSIGVAICMYFRFYERRYDCI